MPQNLESEEMYVRWCAYEASAYVCISFGEGANLQKLSDKKTEWSRMDPASETYISRPLIVRNDLFVICPSTKRPDGF